MGGDGFGMLLGYEEINGIKNSWPGLPYSLPFIFAGLRISENLLMLGAKFLVGKLFVTWQKWENGDDCSS